MKLSWQNITWFIANERSRQDDKWGPMRERNVSLATMHLVLSEEVGEVAQAILRGPIDGRDNIREELIHVASVAAAMLEAYDLLPYGFEDKSAG